MRNQKLLGMFNKFTYSIPVIPIPINIGTTMGSQKNLEDATEFIRFHSIKPIVSEVLEGLDQFEKGFDLMQKGDQFGKIVMKVRKNASRL